MEIKNLELEDKKKTLRGLYKTEKFISNGKGKMSFIDLLGLVFIALKLNNSIDWSWLWVLSPFWIKFLVIFILTGVVKFIIAFYNDDAEEECQQEDME